MTFLRVRYLFQHQEETMRLCWSGAVYPCFRRQGVSWRITKTSNKWLRLAFIEAVQPATSSDSDLYAYCQQLRINKYANASRVATARELLPIVYRVLSQEHLYQRRARRSLIPATLVTS